MSSVTNLSGVWFVYDGECPICQHAANALQIRKALGPLNLLDARESGGHPLMTQINDRALSLDEGMVIYHDGNFYHGRHALEFMAVFGASDGLFNRINRLLFRSKWRARVFYPVMRAGRNILLRMRGKDKIANLTPRDQPIFGSVFGTDWEKLPSVMHKHYANRPFSDDRGTAIGIMKVEAGTLLRLLAPLSELLGGIPAYTQANIPVKVIFESSPDHQGLTFNRTFSCPGRKPYIFRSTMMPIEQNLLAEQMRFGLCWLVNFRWENDKVCLHHKGYGFRFFGSIYKVPLNWLLGTIEAQEKATGPNSFSMSVEIRHPLWGTYYRYSGSFEMVEHD